MLKIFKIKRKKNLLSKKIQYIYLYYLHLIRDFSSANLTMSLNV